MSFYHSKLLQAAFSIFNFVVVFKSAYIWLQVLYKTSQLCFIIGGFMYYFMQFSFYVYGARRFYARHANEIYVQFCFLLKLCGIVSSTKLFTSLYYAIQKFSTEKFYVWLSGVSVLFFIRCLFLANKDLVCRLPPFHLCLNVDNLYKVCNLSKLIESVL